MRAGLCSCRSRPAGRQRYSPSNSRSGTFGLPFNHNCICRGCNGVEKNPPPHPLPRRHVTPHGRIWAPCPFRLPGEISARPIAARQRRPFPHFLLSLAWCLHGASKTKETSSWRGLLVKLWELVHAIFAVGLGRFVYEF